MEDNNIAINNDDIDLLLELARNMQHAEIHDDIKILEKLSIPEGKQEEDEDKKKITEDEEINNMISNYYDPELIQPYGDGFDDINPYTNCENTGSVLENNTTYEKIMIEIVSSYEQVEFKIDSLAEIVEAKYDSMDKKLKSLKKTNKNLIEEIAELKNLIQQLISK